MISGPKVRLSMYSLVQVQPSPGASVSRSQTLLAHISGSLMIFEDLIKYL